MRRCSPQVDRFISEEDRLTLKVHFPIPQRRRSVLIGRYRFLLRRVGHHVPRRVHAAGVVWGYHPPEDLMAAGAEILVDHYDELPALLVGLVEGTVCALAPS